MRQLSLILADSVQAVGALMNVRWVHSGVVEIGTFCTIQGLAFCFSYHQHVDRFSIGAVKQTGDTSVAISTMVSWVSFLRLL